MPLTCPVFSGQVRIFVNQLYGPADISAGVSPDYRSDMLAIRFASFNPILDPWVYILCRKNLLLKGCEKLKRAAAWAKDGRGKNGGWVAGQNSPRSLHSDETSYASLRTAGYRNDDLQLSINNRSFADFAMRQAWEYDTARASFHPFNVESSATIGGEEENKPSRTDRASPGPSAPAHIRRVDIVACSFSTPSSSYSTKCI